MQTRCVFYVCLFMNVWPWVSFAFTAIFSPSPNLYRFIEYERLKDLEVA